MKLNQRSVAGIKLGNIFKIAPEVAQAQLVNDARQLLAIARKDAMRKAESANSKDLAQAIDQINQQKTGFFGLLSKIAGAISGSTHKLALRNLADTYFPDSLIRRIKISAKANLLSLQIQKMNTAESQLFWVLLIKELGADNAEALAEAFSNSSSSIIIKENFVEAKGIRRVQQDLNTAHFQARYMKDPVKQAQLYHEVLKDYLSADGTEVDQTAYTACQQFFETSGLKMFSLLTRHHHKVEIYTAMYEQFNGAGLDMQASRKVVERFLAQAQESAVAAVETQAPAPEQVAPAQIPDQEPVATAERPNAQKKIEIKVSNDVLAARIEFKLWLEAKQAAAAAAISDEDPPSDPGIENIRPLRIRGNTGASLGI